MSLHSLIKTLFYRFGFSIKRLRPSTARTGRERRVLNPRQVREIIHAVDPYAGFDAKAFPMDLQGWGSDSPAFRELILERKPGFVIEVGTWKGASALHMADVLKEAELEAEILCVDTWLGALEFWTDQSDPDRYGSLNLRNGWPQVYYQFLANVCHRGHQERIIPFPQTSAIAALWLRTFGVRADLIYLDGSHEEEDVYADVMDYWDLLSRGGILFGDDWTWDGVRLAVQRFSKERRVKVRFLNDKWVMEKA